MELIVVSYPEVFPDEQQVIEELFNRGMKRFHLRKPNWKPEQIQQLLTAIPARFCSRIVLHDHFALAEQFQLGGIHFTYRTKPAMSSRLEFGGSKSVSCHSLEELEKLDSKIDYAFLSPVFSSISKKGYESCFDYRQISDKSRQERNYKLFALGGISESKIQPCVQLGFDGVAVLGTLWQEKFSTPSIIEQFIKISNACQKSGLM